MLVALIMAGGKGKRFWPLSTDEKPKQFLNLIGKKTMIQMTVDRIKSLIPLDRIFISTGECYKKIAMEQLPYIPERNFILEPEGRNTAPCITLSTMIIERYYKDATIIVLPSDHLIEDEEGFKEKIILADKFIQGNESAILTLGITPDRPETGYGYIKYINSDNEVKKVERFVEKPSSHKAEEYLRSKEYLWNSGMFIWKSSTILREIRQYQSETFDTLREIMRIKENEIKKFVQINYKKVTAISIDYAVLEKAKNIYIIPSNIGWDDIGSFSAVERYSAKDLNGNIIMGNGQCLKGKENLIIATTKKIIVDELEEIYLIESDNKVIIGKKSKINNLSEIRALDN